MLNFNFTKSSKHFQTNHNILIKNLNNQVHTIQIHKKFNVFKHNHSNSNTTYGSIELRIQINMIKTQESSAMKSPMVLNVRRDRDGLVESMKCVG